MILPTLGEATYVWLRIGLLSFGGPAGQIALLHREVVAQRRWVGERRFLHALNFCTLLPGPEAQQLATYLGWLMHGVRGGLLAGGLFVVPGAVVMLALSVLYATVGTVPVVAALFFGLKCAVLVLVVEAVLRIGRRALRGRVAWALAGVAFVALFVFGAPFPLVVVAAGLVGFAVPGAFAAGGHGSAQDGPPALIDAVLAADPARPARQAAQARRAGLVGGVVGSLLTLWVTFLPCFAFVFLGAPLIERVQQNRALSGALAAITAAVVGVIANLALWFGLRVLFRTLVPVYGVQLPVLSSADPAAIVLAILAALALFRFRLGVLGTLGVCAVAGTALGAAGML